MWLKAFTSELLLQSIDLGGTFLVAIITGYYIVNTHNKNERLRSLIERRIEKVSDFYTTKMMNLMCDEEYSVLMAATLITQSTADIDAIFELSKRVKLYNGDVEKTINKIKLNQFKTQGLLTSGDSVQVGVSQDLRMKMNAKKNEFENEITSLILLINKRASFSQLW